MNEQYQRKLEMFMAQNPRPRGWPGNPRRCMDCVHKPEEVKLVVQARGQCEVDEFMEDGSPCPEFKESLGLFAQVIRFIRRE